MNKQKKLKKKIEKRFEKNRIILFSIFISPASGKENVWILKICRTYEQDVMSGRALLAIELHCMFVKMCEFFWHPLMMHFV